MNKRMQEYNRGRDQGLDMAYRLLMDAGESKAAKLIQDEIRARGKMPVKMAVTSKEIHQSIEPIKLCMYESFMCMSLMCLRDEFGFGKQRCLKFIRRWNFKSECMGDGLVNWADMILAIKDELDIDVPTESMKKEGLIA